MKTDNRPILVAVRQVDEAAPAVRFAVEEAARRGCGIHVVHVVHPYPVNSEELVVGGGFVGPARELVTEVVDDLRARVGDRTHVSSDVLVGLVVPELVRVSELASMVVLGERDHTGRRWTGSVRTGVSAHASVPVVSVPSAWPQPRSRQLVAAGISDPATPGPALRAAIRIGRDRGSRVRLVHALWFTEPLDDTALSPERIDEWTRLAESQISDALEGLEDDAIDVDVEVRVTHGRPAEVLVRTSEAAALLVVGRRETSSPVGARLDHVVRSVLQHASCPVMVVPSASGRANPRERGPWRAPASIAHRRTG